MSRHANIPSSSATRALLVTAAQVLTGFPGRAADWAGANGGFGNPSNWAGATVPGAEAVNILNGGTAGIAAADSFAIGPLLLGGHGGQGGIIQAGGCLTTLRIIIGGDDAAGGGGAGFYQIMDGTLRSAADEIWIGSKGGEGSLSLAGNSLVSSAGWVVVGRDGASGHLSLTDASALEVDSMNLPVGCNSNGFTSTMDVSGRSRVTVAGEIWVGWLGDNRNHGILNVRENGMVSTGGGLVVGRNGARGTLVAEGNSVVDAGGYLVFGADPGGRAEVTLADDAHVHAGKQIWLGAGGASATVVMNGGCLTGHSILSDDPSGAGIAFRNHGELIVNGGEISTPGFIKTAGHALILFNRGLIRATGTPVSGGFFANFENDELRIETGGLEFDTADLEVEVTQSLQGDGDLTKSGAGSLILEGSAGHDGDTVITGGELVFRSPILSDFHSLRIDGTNSRVRLERGSTDRIARLAIDGATQPAGLYQSVTNPGSGFPTNRIVGDGQLLATFGPDDFLFGDWAAAHPPVAGFGTDSDGDGLPNGIEHLLGTDPASPTPQPLKLTRAGGHSLVLRHPRTGNLAADVTYDYEWSRNLTNWRRNGGSDSSGLTVTITEVITGSSSQVRFESASDLPDSFFVRIVASQPAALEH